MKKYLLIILILLSYNGFSQKYMLLDKAMYLPVRYANNITATDEYKNMFAIENAKVKEFLKALDNLILQLNSKAIPETFNYFIGNTKFFGIKVKAPKEERMDIVLTSNCDGRTISMHLSDGQVTNASNIYFIKTWAGYIRENLTKK